MSPSACDSTCNPRSELVRYFVSKSSFSCGIFVPRKHFCAHSTRRGFGASCQLQASPCSDLPVGSRRASCLTLTFSCPSSSVHFDAVDSPAIPSQFSLIPIQVLSALLVYCSANLAFLIV